MTIGKAYKKNVWEITNLKKDDITYENLNALAEKLQEGEPCDSCSP